MLLLYCRRWKILICYRPNFSNHWIHWWWLVALSLILCLYQWTVSCKLVSSALVPRVLVPCVLVPCMDVPRLLPALIVFMCHMFLQRLETCKVGTTQVTDESTFIGDMFLTKVATKVGTSTKGLVTNMAYKAWCSICIPLQGNRDD